VWGVNPEEDNEEDEDEEEGNHRFPLKVIEAVKAKK
jgi:hypothetical protein